jgi:hypothetical protein
MIQYIKKHTNLQPILNPHLLILLFLKISHFDFGDKTDSNTSNKWKSYPK